jgi:outer membrane cobalamin receptor
LDLKRTSLGDFRAEINAFRRDIRDAIVLLGNDKRYMYQNLHDARSQGLENIAGWSSPRRLVHLAGQLTWQDLRNTSSRGTFAAMHGVRIPNRPYLWGAWEARLRFTGLPGATDAVEPFYYGRYVHEYFRGWESFGQRDTKQVIPEQVLHSAGVTWIVHNDFSRVSSTIEVDNLTDAMLFDAYGVQRPRRGVYLKLTGELL